MKIAEYIKGARSGKRARDFELRAMSDDFLSDAVDGYFSTPGDHLKNLNELENRTDREFMPRRYPVRIFIYVIVLLLVAGGVYGYFHFKGEPADAAGDIPAREDKVAGAVVAEDGQMTLRETEALNDNQSLSPPTKDRPFPSDDEGMAHEKELPVEKTDVSPGVVEPDTATRAALAPQKVRMTVYESYGESVAEIARSGSYISHPKIGMRRFAEYLDRAVVIPEDGAKGEVVLTFRVNRYGRPSGIRVVGMVSPEAHKEAIRLLDGGPEWTETDEKVTVGMRFL